MADAAGTIRPARSVRYRLLAIALLPMLVILPLLLGVTVYRWNEKFDATLISKVNGDLTIAHQYLAHILDNTGEHVTALGGSARFRDVVNDESGLKTFLADARARLELDFLYVIDPDGGLVTSVTAETAASLRTDWPVIRDLLRKATPSQIAQAKDILSGAGVTATRRPSFAGIALIGLRGAGKSTLGKTLAKRIVPELQSREEPDLGHDSSTNALIRAYRERRD